MFLEEKEKEKEENNTLKVTAALLAAISDLPKSSKSWIPSREQELVLQAISSDDRSCSTYWGEDEGCDPTEKENYISNLKDLGFRVEEKQNRIYFSW